jgi:hypothetical protein
MKHIVSFNNPQIMGVFCLPASAEIYFSSSTSTVSVSPLSIIRQIRQNEIYDIHSHKCGEIWTNLTSPKSMIIGMSETPIMKKRVIEIAEPTQKPFVDETELANEWGLRPNTLAGWRVKGIGPKFIRIGRLIRYRRADLETYLAERTGSSNAQLQEAGIC